MLCTMKTVILSLTVLISFSAFAQPTVSAGTAPAADTIIFTPTSTVTLSGTAVQKNPGHPVKTTDWTQVSGPAATITNASNLTTTVTGLSIGAYVFMLTATDKSNSATATVNVTVISGILPVSFGYFHASRNDEGIVLKWQTTMESNSSVFVIQRSMDAINFSDIAFIPTQAKNGNSSIPLTYTVQLNNNGTYAGMQGLLIFMTILGGVVLISRLNKTYKCLVLATACYFCFPAPNPSQRPILISRLPKPCFASNRSMQIIRSAIQKLFW